MEWKAQRREELSRENKGKRRMNEGKKDEGRIEWLWTRKGKEKENQR